MITIGLFGMFVLGLLAIIKINHRLIVLRNEMNYCKKNQVTVSEDQLSRWMELTKELHIVGFVTGITIAMLFIFAYGTI